MHNPVDWYPWGEEALQRAKKRKPPDLSLRRIQHLLLVPRHGAAMFRGRRNRRRHEQPFVCIKVDREERPDIDQLYMTALQVLTDRGAGP